MWPDHLFLNIWNITYLGVSSKCFEDHLWHKGHTQTDIAEFDQMPTKVWFAMAQLYREVAVMNRNRQDRPHCAHYGIARSSAVAELGFLGRIGRLNLNFCSWRSCTEPYSQHQYVLYFIHSKTYTLAWCQKFSKLYIPTYSEPGWHRQFARLLIVWGHWTMTTGPKYVVFHISKEK